MRDLVAVDQELAPPTVSPVCSIRILAEAIDSPVPHFRHLLVGWVPCSERLPGALLDRLTHHVHILEMNGESYRLKHSRDNSPGQALDDLDNP